ncbi:MAG TPA: restriction endonuclease subunit S [Blastocatellia bacterium]|nr:restriction endonuclease subunit S [Blastocatellia bacterium]
MKSVIDGLPVGWIWASISEIANLASGQTPKGIDRFSNPAGDIPWLRISDMNRIGNERLMNNAEVLVSNQDVRSLGLHVRPAGTIIFPKRGGAIATNKKRLLVRPSAYDLNTMGIISPPELTDYLWWWFATIDLAKLSDGSNVPQINHGDIEFLRVPLPPINEQLRIVAEIEKQFTRLDAAVAALKRVQANLKRYRASVLKAACEGKLVPTEAELARAEGRDYERADKLLERILKERRAKWEANQLAKMKAQGKTPNDDKWKGKYQAPAVPSTSIFPKLPEGWKQVNTEQVTSIITDGEHITPQRSESGVLLLSARNVLDGKLSLRHVDYIPEIEYERISKRLVIEAGDVLLSCSGTVGRSCIAPEKLRFTLVRSVAVLKPFFEMGKFLSLAIRSIQLQSQISTKKTQTAQANIFQGKIKSVNISVATTC